MPELSEDKSEPKKLAVFDLDYTLTRRGTWGRFTGQLIRFRPHLWVPFLWSALSTQRRYKKGLVPRVEVKKAMMKWAMKGKSRAELEAAARKFADAEVPGKLRPGGLRTLKAHKDNGDTIVIISAAVDVLVKEIAQRLDIEHYMATVMDFDPSGTVKMTFASPNCYGEEKCVRMDAFLKAHPDMADLPSIMYSDSHSDIFLMRQCDKAVAVHPSDKLKKLASEYGFPLVNWDK